MTHNAICVIPARYASTRLHGKPLLKLKDKPIVIWVYEAAQKSNAFREVIIATDDLRIAETAQKYGAKSVMTDPSHPSGSDRVWEVVKNRDYDIVVNLQGDEPFITPSILSTLISTMYKTKEADIATPIRKARSVQEILSKNTAKVVIDKNGFALYFSRAPIPSPKEKNTYNKENYFIHLGIYAYRKMALRSFVESPRPQIEKTESLEQLRALWNGLKIKTVLVEYSGISIDTPEDYKHALGFLGG